MKTRPNPARWVAILIIFVGILGILFGLLNNGWGNSEALLNVPVVNANFYAAQVLALGILWLIVGLILLWLLKDIEEASIDTSVIGRLETQVKQIEGRLDSRVKDVDTRVLGFSGQMQGIDTRVKALEGLPGEVESIRASFKAVPAPVAPKGPDDLKIVEGIGPKMEQALKASGIDTFVKLAAASEDQIRAAIQAAGLSFAPSVPTWARQAQYVVDGDMAGLQAYQEQLTAGRE
jgi:predicted flap endonuclease-1-like 5' DNA nuclease